MMIKLQQFLRLDSFRNVAVRILGSEFRTLFGAAAFFVFIVALPLGKLLWERPPGFAISGLEPGVSDDLAIYFSYIEQASSGKFLLKDLYTFEEGAGTINFVWWFIGIFAKIFNLTPPGAFHLSRIILAPILVFVLYFSISFFLKRPSERILALILTVFGSGLGAWAAPYLQTTSWTLSGYFSAPLDLSVPEFSVFWSSLYSPHFILSWIFLAVSAVMLIWSFETASLRKVFYASLLGFFYFHFHPYYAPFLIVFAAILSVVSAIRAKEMSKFLSMFAIYLIFSAVPVFYHATLIISDYVSMARAAQNRTWSPPLSMTFIGVGIFLPLAILGARRIKNNFKGISLIVWSVLHPVFMYIPFSSQRRFSEGWILPLAILSVYALKDIGRIARKFFIFTPVTRKLLPGILFFIFFAYSNYSILSVKLRRDISGEKAVYFSDEFIKALRSIEEFPGNNVLALPTTAKVIPYLTGKRVYAGHWAETIFSKEKFKLAIFFYSEKANDEWRKKFLERNKISLIFWDGGESLSGWDPRGDDFLRLIYEDGINFVFAVN